MADDGEKNGGYDKIILVAVMVGNICNWTAFLTSTWARQFNSGVGVDNTYTGIGLWKRCTDGGTASVPTTSCTTIDAYEDPRYGAIQGLITVGFIGFNVMLIVAVGKVFTNACISVPDVEKVTGMMGLFTAGLYITGVVVFAVEYGNPEKYRNAAGRDGDLGYSFVMAVLSVTIQVLIATILVIAGCRRSREDGKYI